MQEKKKLLQNTFIIALGRCSTQVLSFLLLPLYTSLLSTSEYGNYDLLKSQNPAAVAQGMENLYGHAFKYDETAKSYVLKDAYKDNPKYQQIATKYNNYMKYVTNPANMTTNKTANS